MGLAIPHPTYDGQADLMKDSGARSLRKRFTIFAWYRLSSLRRRIRLLPLVLLLLVLVASGYGFIPARTSGKANNNIVSLSQLTEGISNSSHQTMPLSGFSFEVFGKVQGVSFRKYTELKAEELQVSGWIRNHKGRGTVQGQVICEADDRCQQMKEWLSNVGSPMSSIEKASCTPMVESSIQELRQELGLRSSNQPPRFEIRKSKMH